MSTTLRDKVHITYCGEATKENIRNRYEYHKRICIEKGKSEGYFETYDELIESNDENDYLLALCDVARDASYKRGLGYYGITKYATFCIVGYSLYKCVVESSEDIHSTSTSINSDGTISIDAVYYNGGTNISVIIQQELELLRPQKFGEITGQEKLNYEK